MAGTVWFNRGLYLLLDTYFRARTQETGFYLALCTDAVIPNPDHNTLGDLVQIAAGAGYTSGGIALSANSTDFPTLTENDSADEAFIIIKDLTFTATGGPIPLSGSPVSFAVLTGPGATVSARNLIVSWNVKDSGGNGRAVSDTQSLLVPGLKARLYIPA